MGKNNILHMSGVASLKLLTKSTKSVLTLSWAGRCYINVSVFPQMAEDDDQNLQPCSRGASQDLGKAVVGSGTELRVKSPQLK